MPTKQEKAMRSQQSFFRLPFPQFAVNWNGGCGSWGLESQENFLRELLVGLTAKDLQEDLADSGVSVQQDNDPKHTSKCTTSRGARRRFCHGPHSPSTWTLSNICRQEEDSWKEWAKTISNNKGGGHWVYLKGLHKCLQSNHWVLTMQGAQTFAMFLLFWNGKRWK